MVVFIVNSPILKARGNFPITLQYGGRSLTVEYEAVDLVARVQLPAIAYPLFSTGAPWN